MFKKIKELIRDEELVIGFREHLRNININATVLESEPKVQAFTNFIGSVKVENRNINLVEIEMKAGGGEWEGIDFSANVYRYNYLVQAKIDGLENKLKVEAKPIKKGFLSKEVVGLKWEGGSLAQLLNADSDLKTKLLQEGLVEIEIRPDKKNQCIRIRQKPFHSKTMLALPTRDAFEIYDRIAQRIRRLANTRP